MEILSVTLKNFKSHSDRQFNFQPGTNAICGENGAGKTSILEAIAWVLFDYSGDYNKDDLIRNGAGSAQARVAFVSSRDGRTYEAQRCTTKGYTLYDPQLNERLSYSRIREEILPWLRQQLGVAPGTDLGQLFSSTIGVPQGTFTADFLLTKEKRKPIFDKILKVEEYQQTWKQLIDLEKYAKAQVESLEREMTRYAEELEALPLKEAQYQQHHQAIEQSQTELQQAEVQLAELVIEQKKFNELSQRSQQLDAQFSQLEAQIQTQQRGRDRLLENLKSADAAVAICTELRPAFQAFQQAEECIKILEQKRRTEQTLYRQKQQQEKQLSDRQRELDAVALKLERVTMAQHAMTQLEPLATQQTELERAHQALMQQLQELHRDRQTLSDRKTQLSKIQIRQKKLDQEIAHLNTLSASVQAIPSLEIKAQRLQEQLSRVGAAAQFEAELRQLLEQAQISGSDFPTQRHQAELILQHLQQAAPAWTEAIAPIFTALQQGGQLHTVLTTGLESILADFTTQTSAEHLQQQLATLHTQLQTARHQQAQVANLERLLAEQAELSAEIVTLQAAIAQLLQQLTTEPTLQTQAQQLQADLAVLNNPKGQIQLHQAELAQADTWRSQQATIETAIAQQQAQLTQLDAQLAEFAALNDEMQTQQTIRDENRTAYETYTAYREMANTRKQIATQVEETTTELSALEQQKQGCQEERDRLRQSFDPEQFQTVQTAYQAMNEIVITLKARLPEMHNTLAELAQQCQRLIEIQTKHQHATITLERKKKTERFIKFSRKAFKEAGPRITERYIQNIAYEADRLFRELLNRPNVNLQWTRDYEILVQEGGHPRRFINLSGGEQMCAALAVRLALLKVLADIDIAFFDEPTTNMDRPRRVQLAEAIANIRTFRQLFVISHDDTFESVTENVIIVQREF